MSFSVSYKLFLALCLISALIWWDVLFETFRLALRNDAYTHILLIIPVSAVLIALRLRDSAGLLSPSPGAGAVLLALAALIGIAGVQWQRMDTATFVSVRWTIEVFALVTWWIGSFVVCFGTRLARACAFPLLFLLGWCHCRKWPLSM